MERRALAAFKPKAELELVLMVKSQDPEAVVDRLRGLTRLDKYQLRSKPPTTIHDVYFDTEDGSLRRNRLNLRIRQAAGEYYITLKRSPGLLSWRRNERQETELPWSQESLVHMLDEILKGGIRLPKPSFVGSLGPVEALMSAGLAILQDRETRRFPREIVEANGSTVVIAELAIDSVSYSFGMDKIRLYEVELEAKSKKGRSLLKVLSKQLVALFGTELKEWRFGKLATGRAIEKLLRDGELKNQLDGENLAPGAYDLALSRLES